MKLLLGIVLRAVAVLVLGKLVLLFMERGYGESADADIGGGAVLVLAIWVLVLGWSWYDGRRSPARTVVARWVGVTVLLAFAIAIQGLARDGDASALIWGPVLAALFVLPALVGGPLGATGRPRAEREPQHTDRRDPA